MSAWAPRSRERRTRRAGGRRRASLRVVLIAAAALTLVVPARSRAQVGTAMLDAATCDSLLAASRVDTVPVTFYTSLDALITGELSRSRRIVLLSEILASFSMPEPFRLSVFSSGVPSTRALRRIGATQAELRAPTVTGVYRFWLTSHPAHGDKPVTTAAVVRPSLVPGLDSAVLSALAKATVRTESDMILQLRITTEPSDDAEPLSTAAFPRVRIVDALPLPSNPSPDFPEEERRAGREGEVVLRFVVDRNGQPVESTLELVRGTSAPFVNAALALVPRLRFSPAHVVDGCPVAQVVEYPIAFSLSK